MKKSWRLILIALLAALLVCTCMSALAEPCEHKTTRTQTRNYYETTADNMYHYYVVEVTTYCVDCGEQIGSPAVTRNLEQHDYSECFVKTTAANCVDPGYDVYTCADCGKTWKVERPGEPARGHNEDDAIKSNAVEWVEGLANCMEQAYWKFDCVTCGAKDVKVPKGPAYQAHQYRHEYVEPTCQHVGYDRDYCPNCKDENNYIEYPQLDHFKDWSSCAIDVAQVKNATCTAEGEEVGTCKHCKQLIRRATPKTGHNMVQGEVVKKPTCTEEGIARAYCQNDLCNYTEEGWRIPALGHHIVAHNPKEESGMPTCTAEGTATYYEACDRCGLVTAGTKTPIPALGHKYEGETEMVVKPTCTSYGLIRVWCARCGDRDAHVDKQVPMVDHVHSDADEAWRTDVKGSYPATCLNTGIAVNLCVNCGGDPQTKVVAKIDHSYYSASEVLSASAKQGTQYKSLSKPTCEGTGKATVYCRYGCKNTQDITIPAAGHKWDAAKTKYKPENKIPTCTEPVTKTDYCSVCGKVVTNIITPAMGHLFRNVDPRNVAATCTEPGLQFGWCIRCNKDVWAERVEPLGHKDGKPVVTAATCTAEGKSETKCERCGLVTKTEVIPKTAHTPVDKVVTEATTSKEGLIETRCSVCNTLLGTKAIPKKPSSSSGSGSGSSSSGSGTGSAVVSNVVTGTINSAGVSAAELGATSTAMVTPIDLSVDGTYTYSLVANGQYVVGTVTFVVSNGTFSASYTVNPGVVVSAPSLVVFANVDALKAGTATTVGFNAIFDGAGDTKVIAAVTMVGTFSTTSATPYVADAAQVAAMKAIVD